MHRTHINAPFGMIMRPVVVGWLTDSSVALLVAGHSAGSAGQEGGEIMLGVQNTENAKLIVIVRCVIIPRWQCKHAHARFSL